MKRPLFTVAWLFMAGIVVGDIVPWSPVWLFAATGSFALATFLWSRATPLWAPLLLLAGLSNQVIHTRPLGRHDLRLQLGTNTEYVTIRGTLLSTPEPRSNTLGDAAHSRTLASVRVTTWQRGDQPWSAAAGKIIVATPGLLAQEFHGGREVQIAGIIGPPPGPAAPGLFDYSTYLSRQGIYLELKCAAPAAWVVVQPGPPDPPYADRFRLWSKKILTLGFREGDPSIELLCAMTLGWRTALNGETSEPYMRSGTMHIFAISGLHISLIAAIIFAVLQVFGLPRPWAASILIPILWFYTGATGWQSSAVRSTVMMSIIVVGWSLQRPPDLLNSLGAAAFLLLVWDPQQLFQAGFQLSFAVVLSLALFTKPVIQQGAAWLNADPFLPLETPSRLQQWTSDGLRCLGRSAATSLVAWLGSIPLVAVYFHLVTPVSLLANLVIVPLSSLALMSSLASLVTGAWWPGASEVFNNSAWLWMECMSVCSRRMADWPVAWWYVRSPSAVTLSLYYAILLALANGWWRRPRWRLPLTLFLLLLSSAWLHQYRRDAQKIELSILSLGGGEALFLRDNQGGLSLVDCGNESAARAITIPFLRSQGVNHMGTFIVTHGDVRNVGGAQLIADNYHPGTVAKNGLRFRSASYHESLAGFSTAGRILQRGATIGPWEVLHPIHTDAFPRADDGTLVLRGTFHGTTVLFLSDLGRGGQQKLMERTANLRADIVIAGLPAKGEPLTNPLLQAIQPRVIVVTDALYPSTARAPPALRRRLSTKAEAVIFTRETGGVTISFASTGWRLVDASGRTILASGRPLAGQTDRDVPGFGDNELLDLDED